MYPFEWIYSREEMIHAIINLVSFSRNFTPLIRWYLMSPPVSKSMTRYSLFRVWKANFILIIRGWLSCSRIFRSSTTLLMLFLPQTLSFSISFIAYCLESNLCLTLFDLTKASFSDNAINFKIENVYILELWLGIEEFSASNTRTLTISHFNRGSIIINN